MALDILFENDEILVINKASFVHCLRGKSDTQATLQDDLENQFTNLSQVKESGLAHRLDYETSGCLLVAKSERDLNLWRSRFQSKEPQIQKTYWAIVPRGIGAQSFELFFSNRYKSSKKVSVQNRGEPEEMGVCQLKRLQVFKEQHEILEVQLIGPGKRHQIRAGLAFLGHPIWADRLYGSSIQSSDYFGLHAHSLQFDEQTVIAPAPWPLTNF